jgi:hypothetical protein
MKANTGYPADSVGDSEIVTFGRLWTAGRVYKSVQTARTWAQAGRVPMVTPLTMSLLCNPPLPL